MSYEEQEARRSRVVVETPTARREIDESHAVRVPEREGISGGTVGVIVVLAVALVTILVLLLLSNRSAEPTTDVATQQPAPVPQTTIIQQPAPQQQPPVVIQQPAPVQQAPIVVNPQTPSGGGSVSKDAAIQSEVDKRLSEDSTFSGLGITATVFDGKVTLIGTVKDNNMKTEVERMVRRIKGVTSIDNQISVMP
jgi:BON domain